ncbi:hypothetical protein [Haloglycomyces albus]|uniref:hypothetical protein n=1 Tax=Haloglycomyces albus TaxID=526067 RepID=UPI00046D0931|nr:hypothetical protein [Haloglycomyces albus]
MVVLAAACGDSGKDSESTDSEGTSDVPDAKPVTAPSGVPSFSPPDGTAEIEDEVNDFTLDLPSSGTTYGFNDDEIAETNRFFLTRYEIEDDDDFSTHESLQELVAEFDKLVNNSAKEFSIYRSQVGGHPAISRYTRLGDGIQQQNYFIPAESELIHVSCQWDGAREDVLAGCEELLSSATWS